MKSTHSRRAGWVFALAALLSACLSPPRHPADTVLRGGDMLTPQGPSRGGLAVGDGQVLAVGSDASLGAWIGTSTRCVDLRGYLVLPLRLPLGSEDRWAELEERVRVRMEAGDVLGSDARVSTRAAVTEELATWVEQEAAYLQAGEQADFVVVAPSPLDVALDDLDGVRVVRVFEAGLPSRKVATMPLLSVP